MERLFQVDRAGVRAVHCNDSQNELLRLVQSCAYLVEGHVDAGGSGGATFHLDKAQAGFSFTEGIRHSGFDVVAALVGAHVAWGESETFFDVHHSLHGSLLYSLAGKRIRTGARTCIKKRTTREFSQQSGRNDQRAADDHGRLSRNQAFCR